MTVILMCALDLLWIHHAYNYNKWPEEQVHHKVLIT